MYLKKINNLRSNNVRGLLAVVPKSLKNITGSIYRMKLLKRSSKCSRMTRKNCYKKKL